MENENKPKSKMPIMALLLVAALAFAAFVPIGNATLLSHLGNILTGVLTGRAPINNVWEVANFTGIANATITGNLVVGDIIFGAPVSLTGTLDNFGPDTTKTIIFNYSATGNNLGVADIPSTAFYLDGVSQLMPCASVGSDYICTIAGMPILNGPHVFSSDFTTSPLFDPTTPLSVSMKIQ